MGDGGRSVRTLLVVRTALDLLSSLFARVLLQPRFPPGKQQERKKNNFSYVPQYQHVHVHIGLLKRDVHINYNLIRS